MTRGTPDTQLDQIAVDCLRLAEVLEHPRQRDVARRAALALMRDPELVLRYALSVPAETPAVPAGLVAAFGGSPVIAWVDAGTLSMRGRSVGIVVDGVLQGRRT